MKIQDRIIAVAVLFTAFILPGCSSVTAKSDKSTTPVGTPTTTKIASSDRTPEPPPQPSSNSPIDLLKEGVLAGYDSTTVGKAFEGTFQNPNWAAFETPKGATVVEFTGTISTEARQAGNFIAHDTYVKSEYPVRFQFTMSADKAHFDLTYIERTPFHYRPANGYAFGNGITREEPAPDQMILDFVYR